MQLNDIAELYISTIASILFPYNFKKNRKNRVMRKVNNCTQEVRILLTKLRGTNSIDIRYNVSYTYATINKIASYIQGVPYRKGFATGVFSSVLDAPSGIEYSHWISEETDEQNIIEFAQKDAEVIITYFLPLLEKCDSPDKLFSALQADDKHIRKSLAGLGLSEWLQISTLLYLGRVEEAVQIFDDWTPIAFFGNQELSVDQKRISRWRIATWQPGNEPSNNYVLFGRQGDGTVIPVPNCYEV